MAIPVLDSIFKMGTTIIDKIWPDAGEEERRKLQEFLTIFSGQMQIMQAEMNGNWMQRSWRPILMLVCTAIIANNYLVAPYVGAIFGEKFRVVLNLDQNIWDLIKLGIGGYVAGRSVEKAVTAWKK